MNVKQEVLELNDDIDFDDIEDTGGDILKEDEPKPDKAALQQQKEEAKLERERIKFDMRMARETAKEQAKEEKEELKEKTKLEKIAGLFGGTDAAQTRAQIVRYREHQSFGPYLKAQGFTRQLEDKILMRMNAKQLAELKDRIKFSLSNKNSGKFYKTIAVSALKAAEPVGERLGVKIAGRGPKGEGGLAHSCNSNPEFHDLLDEIFMEHDLFGFVGPEKRLIMLVIQSAVVVHATNSALENMSPEQKQSLLNQIKPQDTPTIPSVPKQESKESPEPEKPKWTIEKKYSNLL
jgi:hypothetical protein